MNVLQSSRQILVSLAICVSLTSCASLSPPKRPDYTGPDQVTTFDASQIIGQWRVTELNPLPDTTPSDTTIEYRADGTAFGVVIPRDQQFTSLGSMKFEMTADWSVEGEQLVHTNYDIAEVSGSEFGALMTQVMKRASGSAKPSTANLMELSRDRMIMLGSDGAAMQYDRL